MLREFFDVTKDSREIFEGLDIMGTECAAKMNTCPVIYLTFKDCKARTAGELLERLKGELYSEYLRYEKIVREHLVPDSYESKDFYIMIETLRNPEAEMVHLVSSLQKLTQIAKEYYQIAPILLIDEYDQPIMSSYDG